MYTFSTSATSVVALTTALSVSLHEPTISEFVSNSEFSEISEEISYPISEACNFLLLQCPIGGGWEIGQPLFVRVQFDEHGNYIMDDLDIGMYGIGSSYEEALSDYTASLIEYHELLDDRDDPPTQALFRYVDRFIHRI